jgi:hypothetical protein
VSGGSYAASLCPSDGPAAAAAKLGSGSRIDIAADVTPLITASIMAGIGNGEPLRR